MNEPIFQKGFEIAEVSHFNSEQYDDYLKSILAFNEAEASFETAFEEGKIKGQREGKAEGETAKAVDVAKKMRVANLELALIAALTGLSESDIAAL